MLEIGTKVVANVDGKWYIAEISKSGNLTKKKQIKKLGDVRENTVTLKSFVKDHKIDVNTNDILSKLKCKSLYILTESGESKLDESIKSWEKRFWAQKNPLCNTCKNKCKQSHRVDVIYCRKYEGQ